MVHFAEYDVYFNNLIPVQKRLSTENDNKSQNLSVLHLDVPKNTVAFLIGRSGKTIEKIESENNVSVSFIDSSISCLAVSLEHLMTEQIF